MKPIVYNTTPTKVFLLAAVGFFYTSIGLAQNLWMIEESNCFRNGQSTVVLVAGHFFDENSGIVVGDTGKFVNSSVRIAIGNSNKPCSLVNDASLATLNDIQFFDRTNGWLVGSRTTAEGKSFPVLLETRNGGTDWVEKQVNPTNFTIGDDAFFHSIRFTKTRAFLVASIKEKGEIDNRGVIFSSDMTGKSWKKVAIAPTAVEFRDLKFDATGNYGWAITDKGTIYVSTDSGCSWKLIISRFAHPFMKLFPIDRHNVWITTESNLLMRSNDGGKTWNEVAVEVPREVKRKYAIWFSAIYFRNLSEGWIGGSGGLILRTVDGGNSWKSETFGLSDFIYSIQPAGRSLIAIGKSELLKLKKIESIAPNH